MNVRARWTAIRRWYDTHSTRDRRIVLSVVGLAVVSIVYVVVIDPLRGYRRALAEEIGEGRTSSSARHVFSARSTRCAPSATRRVPSWSRRSSVCSRAIAGRSARPRCKSAPTARH